MNQLFCSNSSSSQHPTKDYTPSSRSVSRKNPSIANVYPSYAPVFCSRHLGQRRPLPGLPGGGPGAVERGQGGGGSPAAGGGAAAAAGAGPPPPVPPQRAGRSARRHHGRVKEVSCLITCMNDELPYLPPVLSNVATQCLTISQRLDDPVLSMLVYGHATSEIWEQ